VILFTLDAILDGSGTSFKRARRGHSIEGHGVQGFRPVRIRMGKTV
jgi:hypothetical protein